MSAHLFNPAGVPYPFDPLLNAAQRLPSAGEETCDRLLCGPTAITLGSGVLRAAYFCARRTEPITKLLLTSVGAAAATPTLVRAGIYRVAADGSLDSLLAAIANDTTIFATANTEYLRSLTSTFNKVAGTWYAFAQLVVTAATAPTVPGATLTTSPLSGATQGRPRLATALAGLSDLPASVAAANSTAVPYGLLVP